MNFEIRVAAWIVAYARKTPRDDSVYGIRLNLRAWEARERKAIHIASYARAEACRRMILEIRGIPVREVYSDII